MKRLKENIIVTLCLVFILTFISPFAVTSVGASNFRDVPSNHFALEAIRWVSNPANGSFMVGDAAGNFSPGRVMDSFETVITLAMAAGFQYSPASITPAQQAMLDQAYQRHRPLLTNMANIHPNWRRSADREVAFLLELGVLTADDLNRFMIRDGNNVEMPAPLSKEMATTFVLRLVGVDYFPEPGFRFRDDSEFFAAYRRYAYLAHSMGIVGDYGGYFTPRRHITRAEFAQICHSLRIAAPGSPGATEWPDGPPPTSTATPSGTPQPPLANPSPTPSPAPTPAAGGSNSNTGHFASTMQGSISLVLPNSIQITNDERTVTHPFGTNPVIVIDNERRGVSDLAANMLVAVGLNANGQIISLLARTPGAGGSESAIIATPLPPLIQPPVAFPTPNPSPVPTPTSAHNISGTLVGRYVGEVERIIEIEDRTGLIHIFTIYNDTEISRNGEIGLEIFDLRIGDEIAVRVESGRLVFINASGLHTSIVGVLEEIHIDQQLNTITMRQENDIPIQLVLPTEVYDVYELRLGMELRLSVESREVYALRVDDGSVRISGFIGTVQSLRHGHTMVVSLEDGSRRTIRVDGNTMNTATNESFDFRSLRRQMRVYIVMFDTGNTARSLTILPN